jgi:hypothetical protein
MLLEPGTAIRTGQGAGAVLVFACGSVVRLSEMTETMVGRAGVSASPSQALSSEPSAGASSRGPVTQGISVFVGSVWLEIMKRQVGMTSFEVETPSATIAVRGTSFGVWVGEDGTTQVWVESGLVEVFNDAGSVMVGPGKSAFVRKGEGPRPDGVPGRGAGQDKEHPGKGVKDDGGKGKSNGNAPK